MELDTGTNRDYILTKQSRVKNEILIIVRFWFHINFFPNNHYLMLHNKERLPRFPWFLVILESPEVDLQKATKTILTKLWWYFIVALMRRRHSKNHYFTDWLNVCNARKKLLAKDDQCVENVKEDRPEKKKKVNCCIRFMSLISQSNAHIFIW